MGFKEKKKLKCNTQDNTESLDPGDMWTSPGAELSHFIKAAYLPTVILQSNGNTDPL